MNLNPTDLSVLSKQLRSQKNLSLKPFLECQDHTVSRETFSLYQDSDRDMLVTVPRPSEEELPRYYESEDYISHTDSNRNLIERVYQLVRKYAMQRKRKLVDRVNQGTGRILDLGCGTGDFLKVCEDSGWSISGVEPSAKAREIAAEKTTFKEYHSTIDELIDSNPEAFDLITMWHVLEHIPNLYEFIDKTKSLLKPEGVLVVAVPNFKSNDARYYGNSWAAYDVPRHLWHFSRGSIETIFSEFDMKVMEELPMVFDAFYVSLLSEKYRTGKQNYFSAFYRGLISNLKARQSGEYSSLIYLIK